MNGPEILRFSTPEGTVKVSVDQQSGLLKIVKSPVDQLSQETLVGIQEALMKKGLYPKGAPHTDGTETFSRAA